MMNWIEQLALRKIEQGMVEGAFDRLAGQGRPLAWLQQAASGVPWDPGMHVLLHANLLPAWLEEAQQLEESLGALRSSLARCFGYPSQGAAKTTWALKQAALEIKAINHRIDRLRLLAPVQLSSWRSISLTTELERAKSQGRTRKPCAETEDDAAQP